MYIENPVNHFCRDRRERNYFCQTSQEFGSKLSLHHFKHLIVCRHLALSEGLEDIITTDIGCENNQCV